MARPEADITGDGPVQDLARALRSLRDDAGRPTYREMAARGHYAGSVLAAAAAGHRCPTWDAVAAFVRACGQDPGPWKPHWERARAGKPAARRAPRPKGIPTVPRAPRAEPRAVAPPDPWQARTPREYVRQLYLLRAWGGMPSAGDIVRQARRKGRFVSESTVYDAWSANRTALPRLWIVEAIVAVCCPGDLQAAAQWTAAWQALAVEEAEKQLNAAERGYPRTTLPDLSRAAPG